MSTLKYDAIVIGGGPGGIAAAITLARKKLKVLLLERGRFCGAKNLFGGVAYTKSLNNLFPDLDLGSIPKERWVREEGYWLLSEESLLKFTFASEDKPRGFTAFRAKFDPWLAQKAEEEGVLIISKTTVIDFVLNKKGQVQGVITDRPEENSSKPEKVFAPLVIIAEGVNNILTQKLGLSRDFEPEDVVLAVKEVISLPKGSLETRFGLFSEEDGLAVELLGEATCGLPGNGFLYTNAKSLSLGLGVFLSFLKDRNIKPYELLANLKQHPVLKKYLQGASSLEYGAHLIPEWDVDKLGQVYGPGVLVVGDSAGLVNPFSREGTNLAIYSGILAGEVGALAKEKGDYSKEFLSIYLKRLEDSFILKDLRKIKKLKKLLKKEELFAYPYLLNQIAKVYFHADHREKEQVYREIKTIIKKSRGWFNLAKDLAQLMWAFRG